MAAAEGTAGAGPGKAGAGAAAGGGTAGARAAGTAVGGVPFSRASTAGLSQAELLGVIQDGQRAPVWRRQQQRQQQQQPPRWARKMTPKEKQEDDARSKVKEGRRHGTPGATTAGTSSSGGGLVGNGTEAPPYGPPPQKGPLPGLNEAMAATRGKSTEVLQCVDDDGNTLWAFQGAIYPAEYRDDLRRAAAAARSAGAGVGAGAGAGALGVALDVSGGCFEGGAWQRPPGREQWQPPRQGETGHEEVKGQGSRGSSPDGGGTNTPQLVLNLDEAQSFREVCFRGVEAVLRRGGFFDVKIRGDGNCFFVSSTTGVLLWAVCQSEADKIEDVYARFDRALQTSGSSAYFALPEDLKAYVRVFMDYLITLVEAKKDNVDGARLVEKVLRDLSNGADRRETGWGTMEFNMPENALFRGLAVASRILGISTPPHCHQSGEFMDNLRSVSVCTELWGPFDLRPGENLGVHLGLMHDVVDREGSLRRTFYDNDAREEVGAPRVSPELPTAVGIFVRSGMAPHFDLWIAAESPAGIAIAQAEGLVSGEVTVGVETQLESERASQDTAQVDKDAKFALELKRQFDEEDARGASAV